MGSFVREARMMGVGVFHTQCSRLRHQDARSMLLSTSLKCIALSVGWRMCRLLIVQFRSSLMLFYASAQSKGTSRSNTQSHRSIKKTCALFSFHAKLAFSSQWPEFQIISDGVSECCLTCTIFFVDLTWYLLRRFVKPEVLHQTFWRRHRSQSINPSGWCTSYLCFVPNSVLLFFFTEQTSCQKLSRSVHANIVQCDCEYSKRYRKNLWKH